MPKPQKTRSGKRAAARGSNAKSPAGDEHDKSTHGQRPGRTASQTDSTGHSSTRNSPQIPSSVVRKLVAFSLLLLIAPILVYFASLKYVFAGATAPSAIAAVIAANVVLAGYVYAAWVEGDADSSSGGKPKSD